jgi:hypothetical protein
MLTGAGKIGYLLAYGGLTALVTPAIGLLVYNINGLSATLLVIGTIMLLSGLILLWRDPSAPSLRWKLLWPEDLGINKGVLFLILFGSIMVPMQLSLVAWGFRSDFGLWVIAVSLVALVIGWLLALRDLQQSRPSNNHAA